MLEFIQVATGKLPVKARFIIVVCTYCKRINKVSIIIIIIIIFIIKHIYTGLLLQATYSLLSTKDL